MNSKAIIYVRVSTEEQVLNGISLEAQETKLKAYAALHGLEVIEVLREQGVSGTTPLQARPQGATLAHKLSKGNAGHIIALKLDRLFRNAQNALETFNDWDRKGINMHLVEAGGMSINTGSAIGKMFLQMSAVFAEFERNLISERVSTAMAHKKANRQVFNHAPFGFDTHGGELIPNATEQKVIERIQAHRQTGMSYNRIAGALNKDAIPTKTGKQWASQTVKNALASASL